MIAACSFCGLLLGWPGATATGLAVSMARHLALAHVDRLKLVCQIQGRFADLLLLGACRSGDPGLALWRLEAFGQVVGALETIMAGSAEGPEGAECLRKCSCLLEASAQRVRDQADELAARVLAEASAGWQGESQCRSSSSESESSNDPHTRHS